MSDILTKSGLPGTPAVAAQPGDPGYPDQPAWSESTPVQVAVYASPPNSITPGWTFGPGNGDGTGNGGRGVWLPPPGQDVGSGPIQYGPPVLVGYITEYVIIDHPAIPAKPPTPGVAGVAASPYDYQLGWNSGAVSLSPLAGNGEYQFSIPAGVVGVVTGLAPVSLQGNYPAMPWGIYFSSGQYQVIESGAIKSGKAPYAPTDVFSIVVLGGVVTYWKGSSLIYTSQATAVGLLYANAAMYMASDAVDNAAFVTPVASTFYPQVIVNGTLGPVIGNSSNLPGGWCAGTLTPLTVPPYTFVNGILTPVTAYFCTANGFTEDCQGVLPTLTGGGSANLIVPQYAICSCALQSLAVFSTAGSTGGTCAGTLTPLTGFATNTAGGWEDGGTIPGLLDTASGNYPALSYFIGYINSGYPLFAQGSQDLNVILGFNGELSGYAFSAAGGAQAWLTVPPLTLTASGTTTILGEAYLALASYPHYPIMASGTGTTMGRGYPTYGGDYSITALGGAIGTPSYSGDFTLSAHGYAGNLGEAYLAVGAHHYGITASGTQRNFGIVNGTLTGLSRANGGGFSRAAPLLRLVATGHLPLTYSSEAYSCTLIGKADQAGDETIDEIRTTHYTQYPFNQIVRFGDTYYGIGPTAIFALGGNTFAGSNILSVIKTGESDLGEPTLKRPRYLWLGGRVSADLTVTVSAKELTTNSYTYAASGAGSGKWRVTLGKGIETVYLAYTIQNTDGDDFEIQELGPEVDVLRRSA